MNSPFKLKAGMIGRLSVKVSVYAPKFKQVSLLSLFSESIKIEVDNIHLILGSSRDNMSKPTDFSKDPKNCAYDVSDQLTNIAMMHEIVE